jgi:hypothetical protein
MITASPVVPDKRITAADEIFKLADDTVAMAQNVCENTLKKLQLVAIPEPDVSEEKNKAEQPRAYPPLFAQLRSDLTAIRNYLNQIQGTINRTEL